MSFDDIAARLDAIVAMPDDALMAAAPQYADELLALGETILEAWAASRGEAPTAQTVEGFRLLALHRQGARGEPSFNACRETCRELVYHHNLVRLEHAHADTARRLASRCYGGAPSGALRGRQAGSGGARRVLLRLEAAAPE